MTGLRMPLRVPVPFFSQLESDTFAGRFWCGLSLTQMVWIALLSNFVNFTLKELIYCSSVNSVFSTNEIC